MLVCNLNCVPISFNEIMSKSYVLFEKGFPKLAEILLVQATKFYDNELEVDIMEHVTILTKLLENEFFSGILLTLEFLLSKLESSDMLHNLCNIVKSFELAESTWKYKKNILEFFVHVLLENPHDEAYDDPNIVTILDFIDGNLYNICEINQLDALNLLLYFAQKAQVHNILDNYNIEFHYKMLEKEVDNELNPEKNEILEEIHAICN